MSRGLARKRAALFALALLALAAAAGAQPKPAPATPPTPPPPLPRVHWINTFEEATFTAQYSDAPIVVYVYFTNHAACLALEDQAFSDPTFRRLSSLFVMSRVEATRRKDLCDKFEVKRYPTLIFLDSGGAKVLQLDANLTTKRVLNAMGRTFLTSMFHSGKREAKAGHARAAIRRFRMVQIVGEGTPPAQWAQREIDALNAEGVKKFSQAQIALDAGDRLKGMSILDEIVYEYRGTPTGVDAKKLFDKLAGDPKAAQAMKEVTRRRLASRVLALGKKYEDRKDLEWALITYWDVARDWENTPAADEATARAVEIAKDKELALRAAKTRMKRDCDNWLEMAAACEQNHLRDKAIEHYQRVIDNYPDTSYARKAKDAINGILGVTPRK